MLQILINDIARSYLGSNPRVVDLGVVRTPDGDLSPTALFLSASGQVRKLFHGAHGASPMGACVSIPRERMDSLQSLVVDRAVLYGKDPADPAAFLPHWRAGIERCLVESGGGSGIVLGPKVVQLECAGVLDVLYANHGAMLYDYLLSRPLWWSKVLPKDCSVFGIILEQVIRQVIGGRSDGGGLYDEMEPSHSMPAKWIEVCARVMRDTEGEGADRLLLNPGIVDALLTYTYHNHDACAHISVRAAGSGVGSSGEGRDKQELRERITQSVKRFDVCALHVDGSIRVIAAVDGLSQQVGAGIIAKRLADKFSEAVIRPVV